VEDVAIFGWNVARRKENNMNVGLSGLTLMDELKLKAYVMKLVEEWMDSKGFLKLFLNEIVNISGGCEVVANLFYVESGSEFSILRQTGQLDMEHFLVSSGLSRAYIIGRSFRKERKWDDGRHKTEFELIEYEFLDGNLEHLLNYNEDLLAYVIQGVLRSKLLNRRQHWSLYTHWRRGFSRITYKEAIQTLKDKCFELEYGDDLDAKAENILTQTYGIVQVTHYPESIKFWNMRRSRSLEHKGEVDCVDLLLPGEAETDKVGPGETIGGSEREPDSRILREKLLDSPMLLHLKDLASEKGFNPDRVLCYFEPYLELFEQGYYPRSGAGLGMARLFQFLVASETIIAF